MTNLERGSTIAVIMTHPEINSYQPISGATTSAGENPVRHFAGFYPADKLAEMLEVAAAVGIDAMPVTDPEEAAKLHSKIVEQELARGALKNKIKPTYIVHRGNDAWAGSYYSYSDEAHMAHEPVVGMAEGVVHHTPPSPATYANTARTQVESGMTYVHFTTDDSRGLMAPFYAELARRRATQSEE